MANTRVLPELDLKDTVRFISKITFNTGCWEFKNTAPNGYGDFYLKGDFYRAHRVSYELFNKKKLNTQLVIDHLCRNRKCVNPQHLEEVTEEENIRRGEGISAKNTRKTQCNNGHPLKGENLILLKRSGSKKLQRVCRQCKADIMHRYAPRRRERYVKKRVPKGIIYT